MPATKTKRRRFVALYEKQRRFLEADAPIVGWCSGIGAGKSRTGATRILLRAKDGENHLCISPTYNMLKKATLPLMIKVAKELGILKKVVMSPFPILRFTTQDGGDAEATFCSGDHPDDIRGSNNDSLFLDEASFMPKQVLDIAMGRLRGIRGQMGSSVLCFTPRGRSSWTFDVFYEKANVAPRDDDDAKQLGVEKIGPAWYKPRPGTILIRAATWENPFISEEFYKTVRGQYSEQFAAQELEGDFVDLVGLLIKREWLAGKLRDAAPREARRVRYWDLAASEMSGCYTCGTLVSVTPQNQIFVEDVVRGQWSTLSRNYMIESTAQADARKYNNEVSQVIEQEPGSGGKEQAQQMIRMLSGMPVFRDMPSHGQATRTQDGEKLPGNAKITRAQPLAAQIEAGNLYMVRGEWNDEWISELTGFPEMKYCDQVDSVSAGFNFLQKSMVADPGEIGTVRGVSTVPSKYGVTVADVGLDLPTFFKGR